MRGLLSLILFALSFSSMASDKDQYHLFKPTPKEKMRKFRTERPDKTRTAYTIDAGHAQLESELFTTTLNPNTYGFEAFRGNFRIGTTNRTELQVQVGAYVSEKDKKLNDWRRGFGNVTTRFKLNYAGNDEGKFAAAIMPYVTWPTAGAGFGPKKPQLGLILPFDYEISEVWRTGAMLQMNQLQRENEGQITEYIGSYSLSRKFFDKLWTYAEIYHSRRDNPDSQQITTADFVVQYEITENFNMDLGTFLGLTKASDRQVYFLGATWLH